MVERWQSKLFPARKYKVENADFDPFAPNQRVKLKHENHQKRKTD